MAKRDYYEVLGVERGVDVEIIKRSYRKLAFQFHPDRNPDDPEAEEKFKEAAEAYEVLQDPEKRARYDRFGHAGLNGGGGFNSNDDIFSHFSDIFADLFGFSRTSGNGGKRVQAGADLRYNLEISFRQAAKGDEITISVPRHMICDECNGNGAAKGTAPEACPQCGGYGQIRHSQGFFQLSTPCPRCHGQGSIIKTPCPKCRGTGMMEQTRELAVHIPAGVDTGNRLRLRGEGEPGINGGPAGDLFVVLHVAPDPEFERRGQDLLLRREVSFVQAILGGKLEIPSLDETVTLEVPKGTQSGQVFSIAEKGLPFPGQKRRGNLLLELTVRIPSKINREQEKLLLEFQRLEENRPVNKAKKTIKKMGKAMGLD